MNLHAQTGFPRLPQPQQQRPQSSPSDSVPGYCVNPDNVGLPECENVTDVVSNRDDDLSAGERRSRMPRSIESNPGLEPDRLERQATVRPLRQVHEPPSEFQTFVARSVGKMLPIYGASLFRNVPETFAPVDQIPIEPSYVIGPGDELRIQIWGPIQFSQSLIVERSGTISLPQVGPIVVAGLRFDQLQPAVKASVERVYRNFEMSVSMGRLRSIQIFLVGQARQPGSYTVSSLSTLVNALFACGGPSSHGSMRRIQLKRGNTVITTFDLYDFLIHGDKSKDVPLLPGDVILIPAVGQQIAIAGSVESPAIYELKDETSLGQVLGLAGGLSPLAAGQSVVLDRVSQSVGFKTQQLTLNAEGLATALHNGDIIRLRSLVPKFENTVSLRGNVADAGRFPWHPGMRVSDLIPSKELLITRDYWQERNRLVDPEPHIPTTAAEGRETVSAAPPETTSRHQTRDVSQGSTVDSALGASVSNDTPTFREFLPRTTVVPAAPEIDWQYATIERLDHNTLMSSLLPFNLGKVVFDHDETQNLLLEPGDIVTIFSNADISVPREQQVAYVRLEGEVRNAGTYTVRAGETLQQLLERAGGLTPSAYLYGAQLTRESTRREQQKRISDFLDTLQREVDQSASNAAGRTLNAEQAAVAQSALASQRALIAHLRETPASGRIVLDLAPDSKGIDALPALQLENGDRLLVPARPSTVNVVGTVYNQSSFLFDRELRLGDYLQEAGGPTRFADTSHMFVIRADGSVIAKRSTAGIFTRGFDALPMHPGDTLIVPTFVNKNTFIRNLIDWSQVLANFGLGAAAVNILK